MDTLEIKDLVPGDVLLCRGDHLLGKLIVCLDQGDYSHAALYFGGGEVVHAVSRGVKREHMAKSPLLLVQESIDVFRYHKATPEGDDKDLDESEAERVCAKALEYASGEHPYAYDDLLLLGLLAMTRDFAAENMSDVGAKMLRVALDHAAEWIFQRLDEGREPVICSEAVYRFFTEAAPAGSLPVVITGVLFPRIKAQLSREPSLTTLDPEFEASRKKLEDAFRRMMAARAGQRSGSGWDPVVAACVTPRDLQTSPNLRLRGRLRSLRT